MSGRPRWYRVFGLSVASAIDLPELAPGEAVPDPDLDIVMGDARETARESAFHAGREDMVLEVAGVARFTMREGRQVLIVPAPDAAIADIRLFLLGSVMGGILQQRGILPLHANAVEIDGAAIAFVGPSGAGKSTLADWFRSRGHQLVADDVCAIAFEGERPMALPGVQRIRLWRDALEASGREPSAFQRSFPQTVDRDKFDVHLEDDAMAERPLPLGAVVVLGGGPEFTLEPLTGVAAAEAVFAHTYRGRFLAGSGAEVAHWQSCMRLIRSTPVFDLRRPKDLEGMDAQNAAILDRLRTLIGL